MQHELPFIEILLPVGISFFTFHGISYLTDVYRGDVAVCRAPLDMALYMSFFPQLVAGPIVRAAYFLPQLARPADEPIPVAAALLLILGGMVKKVIIANYLATGLVDPVFAAPANYGGPDLLLATYAYAVQIYCDFSAYTDMAIALAALCGFRFPRNFNQPYRAQRLREFWQRWHISLSTWLRDYLYKPLGGNRHGRLNTYRNLMITMLLGGIWHGAAWKFVMWGALHGGGLAVERMMRAVDRPAPDEPRRARSSRRWSCSISSASPGSSSGPRISPSPACLSPGLGSGWSRRIAAGAAGAGRADRGRDGRTIPAARAVRARRTGVATSAVLGSRRGDRACPRGDQRARAGRHRAIHLFPILSAQ